MVTVPVTLFTTSTRFKSDYVSMVKSNRKAKDNFTLFNGAKRKNPRDLLPFVDKPSKGKLKGINHAHLDHDVLLFYQDKGNIIHLIAVLDHGAITGRREQQTAKSLNPHRI